MDWSSLRRSQTLSLPERVSVDLERMVLDGSLKPGDKIPPERELGELLGVSRTSVRAALHDLESRGLVDRRPGRGTVVVAASQQGGEASAALAMLTNAGDAQAIAVSRIMEVRAVVEPPIAGLATQRVTERDIAQLRQLVEDMEAETNLEKYADLDRAFHQAISQYTHNPLLAQLTEIIADQLAPSRRGHTRSRRRRNISSADHRRIFEAIAAGDPMRAEEEARAHVERVLLEVLRAKSEGTRQEAAEDSVITNDNNVEHSHIDLSPPFGS